MGVLQVSPTYTIKQGFLFADILLVELSMFFTMKQCNNIPSLTLFGPGGGGGRFDPQQIKTVVT